LGKQIADFALIGDCETAALVSRTGAVEWLCWPTFQSEACFAALLGEPANGAWSLRPEGEVRRIARRYAQDTLALETRFETATGRLLVIDFMPPRSDVSRLIRIARCEAGEVRVRSELDLRFEYGVRSPWVTHQDGAVIAIAGPNGVRLDMEPACADPGRPAHARFTLKAGETWSFVLAYFESHRPAPARICAETALDQTLTWWRRWITKCRYAGPYREAVSRSLITLKALTYLPTGGVLAAATSSIPEIAGGQRNWDYRFCWLRDATFTLLSLMQAGFAEEAAAWRAWLLRAAGGQPADLQPVYGIAGRRRIVEWQADWLSGFGGARPVRFGNAAADQLQLDIYGEVVDALFQAERYGVLMDDAERRLQTALIDHVAEIWREPDRGIWEVRGRPRRFTHSQAMAWAALDRGVQSAERLGAGERAETWRALRDTMHAEICAGCFDADRQAFTQAFGCKTLDASVLLLPHVGFLPANDPRMLSTVAAIQNELSWDGLIRRYEPSEADDGLSGGEGVFLACSFWLVDALVLQGRIDEARRLFERLLDLRNDLGLLSEEYDPKQGQLVGNFPQAISHLSLINSALGIEGWGAAQQRGRQPE
jgi:GH15 family glucan-1,4-alpha-glucosidase